MMWPHRALTGTPSDKGGRRASATAGGRFREDEVDAGGGRCSGEHHGLGRLSLQRKTGAVTTRSLNVLLC